MFEKTVLRRSSSGAPVTAGQLAEALLYYQNVHLVIDHGTFRALVKAIGVSSLIGLLRRPGVTAVYCEETVGTSTQTISSFPVHTFVAFKFVGNEKAGRKLESKQDRIAYLLQEEGTERKAADRFAKRFLELVPARRLTGDHYIKGGVTSAARIDLQDSEYMRAAVQAALTAIPGGDAAVAARRFEIVDTSLGFHVFTDLDLVSVNRQRTAMLPQQDPVTVALLLSHVLDARTDLALASHYGGDFATSAATSAVLQVRCSALLRRAGLHIDAVDSFADVALPDTPSLSEVIDSGERTFDEFLLMLDRADRFKQWLAGVNPDEGLVRTYLKDVSSEGWIQRLPAKSVRYLIASALDKANPVAGFLAGIADTFLVEKLLSGWRPNHFVDSHFRPFVDKR